MSGTSSLRGRGRGAKTTLGRKKTSSVVEEKVTTTVVKDIDGDGIPDEVFITEEVTTKKVSPTKKPSPTKKEKLDKISVIENTGRVALSPKKSGSLLDEGSAKTKIETKSVYVSPETIATIPMMNDEFKNPFKTSKRMSGMPITSGNVKEAVAVEATSPVEIELNTLGYKTTNVHLHGPRATMIKSINPNGQKVYVSVEKQEAPIANTEVLVPVKKISPIPFSVKSGILEDVVGTKLTSVAIEADDGDVAILTRDENMQPKEEIFVHSSKVANDGTLIYQNATVHSKDNTVIPVISVEEIKVDPELVLATTDDLTRRLRNGSYEKLMREFEELQMITKELEVSLHEFDLMRASIQSRLTASLTTLENWNEIYKQNPPMDEEGIMNHKRILYNLGYRNDAIDVFLSVIQQVLKIKEPIEKAKKMVDDATEHGMKEFQSIEYALNE